jgi:hypothetical protein
MGAGLVLLVILGASASGGYALRDDARELVDQLPKALQRGREAILSQLGSGGKAIQEATHGAAARKQESAATFCSFPVTT